MSQQDINGHDYCICQYEGIEVYIRLSPDGVLEIVDDEENSTDEIYVDVDLCASNPHEWGLEEVKSSRGGVYYKGEMLAKLIEHISKTYKRVFDDVLYSEKLHGNI